MPDDSRIDFSRLAAEGGRPSGFAKAMNLILVLICIALAGLVAYNMLAGEGEAAESVPQETSATQVVNVSVSPASVGTFTKISRLNGEIRRDGFDIAILPDITTTGTVTEVLIHEGDTVSVGDVVAYIDASRPGSPYKISPVIAKAGGTVIDVGVSAGQVISSSTAVATIASNADLVLEAAVPEKFLGSLRTGMTASFETVAYPGRTYTARLAYISPSISTSSRTADIKLDIDGDTDGLKTGMYVKLYLETERIEDALMVPSAALGEYIGDDVVYAAVDGKAVRKIVTPGSDNGTEAVILEGLEPGELVITAGNITDGTAINPISSQG